MNGPMKKVTTLAVVAATLVATPIALGVSAGDPNDVDGAIDIERSSVRTVEIEPGVFRMRLKAVTYDPLDLSDGVGSIYWQIDSRGDARADYEAYVFGDPKAEPEAPAFCLFKSLGAAHKEYVKVAVSGKTAVCAFPRRYVETTKELRWRLAGRMEGVIDRAPDTGWNGG